MDSNICLLYGIILVTAVNFRGTESHKSECDSAEFWNSDADQCVPCSTCKQFPKTPSCDTCTVSDETSYAWKMAAITRGEEPYVSLSRRLQDHCIKYNHLSRG
ncbi:hypothetical protein AAFF_G00378290 [Aldrovandia affinis]|uniref:Uncharacterized protein n=1 Tax=Aldrovandia affinis TaxID=143900 RepID=A0AAD7VZF3_9TELE|nr:hypothetical protein AAFF_G00378290 [Aldrovandia affinis]